MKSIWLAPGIVLKSFPTSLTAVDSGAVVGGAVGGGVRAGVGSEVGAREVADTPSAIPAGNVSVQ